MILAAGVGSRLEPVSHFIPKPLVPVLNVPVIEHILHGLEIHGISNVVANTHYLADTLLKHFEHNCDLNLKPTFLHEPELTGDAGGVRACREFLEGDTFVVIMGDLITNADIGKLIEAHKRKKAIATIGVKEMPDVTRFGVVRRDKDGFIKEFQEKPKVEEAISKDISTGIYVLEPEVFKHIPPAGVYGFGRQLFPALVKAGLPVLGEDIHGFWSDIGTLEDLFISNMNALIGKIPVSKPANHTEGPYSGARISGEILIGNNTSIGEGSIVTYRNIIGNNCIIGKNVYLENCLVFSDSKIPAGTHLKNSIYAFNEIVPMTGTVI